MKCPFPRPAGRPFGPWLICRLTCVDVGFASRTHPSVERVFLVSIRAEVQHVAELIPYLARAVGLPSDVSARDFISGFTG